MNKRITFIEPFSLGSVLGYFYGIVGILMSIYFFISSLFGAGPSKGNVTATILLVIFSPLVYALFGLIQGFVIAYLFNFCARKSGGIGIKIEE
jgi:hypothetical protein